MLAPIDLSSRILPSSHDIKPFNTLITVTMMQMSTVIIMIAL